MDLLTLTKTLVSPIVGLANQARTRHQHRRRVSVLVHRAYPMGSAEQHYYMKVTNLSRDRDIVVTHTWFDTNPRLDILDLDHPRLRPDETVETCVPVAALRGASNAERLGRVRLSNGKTVKSRLNTNVPPVGYMAGRGSQ
jgi:hypothetical protein